MVLSRVMTILSLLVRFATGQEFGFLNESTCGKVEETVSTMCLSEDSLVKSQARATAKMVMGGSCTAWLVKAATSSRGTLMLTTGHCASRSTATFIFEYVNPCGATSGASASKRCTGQRVSAEQSKDEQGIYELERPCSYADETTPILLDIGRPEAGEGMYLIGHPRGRPQELSHQEPHDDGHHCEVRSTFSSLGSQRIGYYCDTQGGNSGSPVFSARTGHAFAIHSHGGCRTNQDSANSGGLLGNSGIVAAFDEFEIPYVNRATTDLFKYEEFVEQSTCWDYHQYAKFQRSLQECEMLCVNSMVCVGIEYANVNNSCTINYRSSSRQKTCHGGSKYFRRTKLLTETLTVDGIVTPPLTPASGFCGFESSAEPYCGIWHQDTLDQFDWTRNRGSTPSRETGPDSAHGGNHYMYTEVSGSIGGGAAANIKALTPTLKPGSFLSFFYHMYGSSRMGTLNINVQPTDTGISQEVWSSSGNQGNEWLQATIPLDSFSGQSVVISFVGIKTEGIWQGDIAIDDVMLSAGASTSTTTSSTTVSSSTAVPSTTSIPGSYFMLQQGTCCCPEGQHILTKADCEMAHDSLGLTRKHAWEGHTGTIPGGCSTRQGNSHDLHWNSYRESDQARRDMTPICRITSRTVTTTMMMSTSPVVPTATTSTVMVPTTTGDSVTTTITSTTVIAVFDPSSPLVTYWDQGRCGPRGNDARADLSSCVLGHSIVAHVPMDDWKIVATIGGCNYYGYTIYQCGSTTSTVTSTIAVSTTTGALITRTSTTSTSMSTTVAMTTTTITRSSTRALASTTSFSRTTTTTSTSSVSLEGNIRSGDVVFLSSRSGRGNMIDVETNEVHSRWVSRGAWQAITIEKASGGMLISGDVVYLKTHLGIHIDVFGEAVQARWEDQGGWQAMVIEKRSGNGAIQSDDIVCFKGHTGKYLDVEGSVVQARYQECGDWQAIRIEKEDAEAVFSGSKIHLLAHTGKRVEVEGTAVAARWYDVGLWQTFVIENYGGRTIFHGDSVFLKAHTGMYVDVHDRAVEARWNDKGGWQQLIIQKKGENGAIRPGDIIFLQAVRDCQPPEDGQCTTWVEVEGETVQARFAETGAWQSLVIEKIAERRLSETASGNAVLSSSAFATAPAVIV